MTHQEKFSCDWQTVNELQSSANELLNWLLQGKFHVLKSVPDHEIDKFRGHLRSIYSLLPKREGKEEVLLKKFVLDDVVIKRGLKEVIDGFGGGKKYFASVVLHGSWATGEAISNWSDVDIFAIVRSEVFASNELFLELRKKMLAVEEGIYKVDPYQHHGIQFISEDDMFYYSEALLPLEVLRNGKTLSGDKKLKFAVRDSINEKESRFFAIRQLFKEAAKTGYLKHHARNDVYLADSFANKKDNFYQLKYLVSVVLLLPSLYLELIDKPVLKRESFVQIGKHFSKKDLELVSACEKARLACVSANLKDNVIPDEVMNELGVNYFKRANVLMDKLIGEYEVYKFSKST